MIDNPNRRFAALDLGTLTVRLAVAEFQPGRPLRVLHHLREITSLGEGLAARGELAPEARARTLAALTRFKQEMERHHVAAYRAVGTQALRQARNREAFLAEVHDSLGLTVEVLSAESEARLSLSGVLSVLNPLFASPPALIFDVGGGSTEFALTRPGGPPRFASLPLGVLTLSQARPLGDPPSPDKVAALKQEITTRLQTFCQETLRPHNQALPRLVGTAGAVTTLAAMRLKMQAYDPQKINNTLLTRAQVTALAELVARLPEAQRARLAGLEPAKAGVIVAGALIVLAIMEVWGQDLVVVIDAGLLEGVLHELAREFSVS